MSNNSDVKSWTQDDRPFRLQTPLGKNALLLERFDGVERISTLFQFTVTAISARDDIVAKDLLLKAVTLEMRLEDGSYRELHGVVSRFTRGNTGTGGATRYELVIVPPHWVLSLDEGFEIFQSMSARTICDTLLKGTPHDWKLVRTLEPRPYCFRYRESRWQCVARLLEQEGIWFRFDHSGGAATLVLGDNVGSAQPAWGLKDLPYSNKEGGHFTGGPSLTNLSVISSPYVAKTRVRSASEFTHGQNVSEEVSFSGAFSPPGDLEQYLFDQQAAAHRTGITHSGGEKPSDAAKLLPDMKTYVRIRQEAAESLAVQYFGHSTATGLQLGAKVQIQGHGNAAMNTALFITAVTHVGSNGSYHGGHESEADYQNDFEAIPADGVFRPARVTPWPRVSGSHVGTVVGPKGEEIYTDKHGRVQVVFKWDHDHSTALDHACWIRVAQPFAGQQFGAVFLPRVGHEVLVEFLDGNPDNPIIVGSLYNNANLPPWTLPDNKTQSGVRTKSTLNGGAEDFNELRFEDKKDAEEIYLQAQKYLNTLVKRSERRHVKANRRTLIGEMDEKIVAKKDDLTVVKEGDQRITIEKLSRFLSVATNQETTIGADHLVQIKGNQEVSVGDSDDLVVGDKQTIEVGGKQKSSIGGDRVLSVSGADNESISGNRTVTVDGKYSVSVNGSAMSITSAMKIELKVGANSITIDQTGVTIKGTMVKVEAKAMAQIKSPMTQVNGDGMLILKGGITMIN